MPEGSSISSNSTLTSDRSVTFRDTDSQSGDYASSSVATSILEVAIFFFSSILRNTSRLVALFAFGEIRSSPVRMTSHSVDNP
jgi:hypothetical protein